VTMENGLVHVVTPIDGTPAADAGVLAGDQIIAIDGQDVQGMTLNDAVDLMRGDPGTDVTITVQREGVEDAFNVTITRAIIHAPQVRTQVFDNIAYIRLTVFGTQTHGEFTDAIQSLIDEIGTDNITGFILDLRNNGGGSLDTSIAIADDFLERGEIVSTRGRNAQDTQRYDAQPGDVTGGRPMIVLVNGGSASASEILAGALQDHRRATIVGTQSYGKGSVQTIFPLGSDLGAIRLTTARYYTPSGRSIQDVGITPDIVVEQPLPESMRALVADTEPVDADGNPITTFDVIPLDPTEDTQLQYALQLMRGEVTDPAYPPPPEANLPQ
jgi:carboxyl-terminal processing protease